LKVFKNGKITSEQVGLVSAKELHAMLQ
jgi:hypothetical protein